MKRTNVIGVAGAGAWGMALANAAAAAGRGVVLWGRDAERMQAFAATRRSDRLPGVDLALVVEATAELEIAMIPHPSAWWRNPEFKKRALAKLLETLGA